EASQDCSRENSIAAGVAPDEEELAVAMFLRYHYCKKMSRTRPSKSEILRVDQNAPLERDAQRFRELRRGLEKHRVLLQRYGSEADDEMRKSPMRLRLRSHAAPWALLRTDIQGPA